MPLPHEPLSDHLGKCDGTHIFASYYDSSRRRTASVRTQRGNGCSCCTDTELLLLDCSSFKLLKTQRHGSYICLSHYSRLC